MSFHDWWTNENNPSLAPKDYLFSTKHIIMLVVAVAVLITLAIVFFKRSERAKKIVLTVLVSILAFFEVTSRIVNFAIETNFTW